MSTARLDDVLPEWKAFAAAVRDRRPDAGTWCEAWTVRDVVIHQAGNAEELTRVLSQELKGDPVPTRGFEEREAPYRAMDDDDLWSALVAGVEQLSEVSVAATNEMGASTEVSWTGRRMQVSWFAEHMREELVLHRWDITGDDAIAATALAEPWMTTHSVVAVGRPLLDRGAAALGLGGDDRLEGRLRVKGCDDVVVVATTDSTEISLARPQGAATIESDAATRCLFLWGRRPADPSRWTSREAPERLRQVRRLLSGY